MTPPRQSAQLAVQNISPQFSKKNTARYPYTNCPYPNLNPVMHSIPSNLYNLTNQHDQGDSLANLHPKQYLCNMYNLQRNPMHAHRQNQRILNLLSSCLQLINIPIDPDKLASKKPGVRGSEPDEEMGGKVDCMILSAAEAGKSTIETCLFRESMHKKHTIIIPNPPKLRVHQHLGINHTRMNINNPPALILSRQILKHFRIRNLRRTVCPSPGNAFRTHMSNGGRDVEDLSVRGKMGNDGLKGIECADDVYIEALVEGRGVVACDGPVGLEDSGVVDEDVYFV